LQQSAFGLGVLYEGLAVFSEGRFGGVEVISPTTLLALVEGVLGYKPVSVDGTSWTYRRDVEFTNR
jgi:hypothetical protein